MYQQYFKMFNNQIKIFKKFDSQYIYLYIHVNKNIVLLEVK